MRTALFGVAAAGAVVTFSSCGTLGLLGVAAIAAWPGDPLLHPKPSRFRVGGTISGLSGNVVLELNSNESLSLSENGPFLFERPIDDQAPFEVRILETPSEQSCSLESALGVVHGRNVNSIQVICAPRTYSIGGIVTDLNGELELRINDSEVLSMKASGPFTFQTQLPKGHPYDVTVTTQPRGQACSISGGASGTVASRIDSITISCRPLFRLGTYQSALQVIGQRDLSSSSFPSADKVGPDTLDTPWGNPVAAGGKFYVSDSGSNRILVFNGLPAQNGASAAFVLGQPDFRSTTTRSGREGFSVPEGLSSDGIRLAVADKGNHRVLIYSYLPERQEDRPAIVIGQPDFDTLPRPACTASTLSVPSDVFVGHGKLIVADTGNGRVLVWNIESLESGAPADLVLGQPSATTCTSNTGQSLPSASTLSRPEGVWTDGKRLLVTDTGNNRVLVWQNFPTTNGQPADLVLGQADLLSRNEGTARDKMFAPKAITSTGEQVFVTDYRNHRVLVWNQFPTQSGTPADLVLGQQDFTSQMQLKPPTDRSLNGPTGLLLATPNLLVTDSGNSRVLIFESN